MLNLCPQEPGKEAARLLTSEAKLHTLSKAKALRGFFLQRGACLRFERLQVQHKQASFLKWGQEPDLRMQNAFPLLQVGFKAQAEP